MTLEELVDIHQKDLNRLNNQRRLWLYASSIVFSGIIFLIFGWDWLSDLQSRTIWWVIIGLMLIISINWWYWTMKVIRIIIHYQEIEYALIKEIYKEINLVKDDLQETMKSFSKKRP